MNAKHLRILDHFQKMGIPINEAVISEYSAFEKDKLESLAERMLFLYTKITTENLPVQKASFFKKEFSAIEWVFSEFNIIAEGTPRIKF